MRHPRSGFLAHTALLIVFAISVAMTASLTTPRVAIAASFTVSKTADTNDGTCDSDCSLREAIIAANASAGADTITLPAGTFTLTRAGVDNTAANGDLDVTGAITLIGAGQGATIIQAGNSSSTAIDRVFSFNPLGLGTGFAVSLQDLTIRNGKNPNAFSTSESDGGCFDFDGGTSGAGSLSLTRVTVSNCETTDGDAGGIALFLLSGGTVSINDSTIQNSIASRNTPNSGNGGGMSVFCVNDSTTATVAINTSIIQNNATRSVGGTNQGDGGGLFFYDACSGTPNFNYQLHGVTIDSNTAGSDGGGIYSTAPLTIDNTGGSTFIRTNSAGRSGGGIWLNHTNRTSTISKTTISGNSAVDGGGGIRLDSASPNNNLALSYSRIVNNTAGTNRGSGLSVNNGTATAKNNWWGCSSSDPGTIPPFSGPSASPCDTAKVDPTSGGSTPGTGSVNFTPWLRVQLTATPLTFVANQSTALEASFLTDSAGNAVALSNLDVLLGQPVAWSGVGGTISGAQASIQSNGKATATYLATAAQANNAAVAKVDNDRTTAGPNVVALTVNKANTTTTITADTPDPTVTGQAFTVSYSVAGSNGNTPTAPTGTVTVSDGINSCSGTVAAGQCTFTAVSVGAKTLTATYGGDANFNGSTSTGAAHTVSKADTTTTITADTPDPSVVGQTVTINYSVTVNSPGSGTPTGNVTISDGTANCTGTIATGSCTIMFTSAGAKTLTATYAGDANYNGSTSAGAAHSVNKVNTTTTISSDLPDPSVVGQAVTVSYGVAVTAPGAGTPTGTVTVTDGINSCTGSVAAGQCMITLATLGGRTLTATYGGDANFNGSASAGAPHTVNQISTTTTITADTPDPSVVGQSVSVQFTVAPVAPGSGTPTGTVTVTSGLASCTASVAVGQCALTFTSVGSKTITATYGGDTNNGGSTSASAAHTVNQAATVTTITADTPDPSVVGQTVTVTFTVAAGAPGAGTPTGTVTVTSGLASCTASVAVGQCALTFTSAGNKTITATYGGDPNFSTSTSAAEPHTVNQAATVTTIMADTPDPSMVGQTVMVTFTVAPVAPGAGTPTGNVTVSDGTVSCTASVAVGTCTLMFTSTGSKTLTATYAGDTDFSGSTSAGAPHTVTLVGTTTTITADTPDPSVVGQTVTVTYTVTPNLGSGTPTGTVTVTEGTVSCTASVATGHCALTFTTAGAKTLTATYSGDSDNSSSTSVSVSHTVNQAATVTTITADTPDPSVVGQTVTVTFTVTPIAPGAGTPTGNVTVSDGTVSCTASVAVGTCTLTFTSMGSKTLTATYAGDANFSTSTSAGEPHTVNQAATVTTITADTPDPSVVGQTVTVTFTVAPVAPGAGTPTGNVTVSDGTVSCTASVAVGTCTLTFTSVGSKTLTAAYAGDASFSTSTSAGEPHTVNQTVTVTTITADTPDPSVVDQTVTVTFTVTPVAPGAGTPTGNVTVSDGTVSCTASVAVGTCTLTFTSVGSKTLTATYAGDANFSGSTSAGAPHTVNQISTTTTITADTPDPSVVGQTVTVAFTVAPVAPGVGTPTGNVTVSDGTVSCTATVAAGQCALTFTTAGTKTLTATYAGDANNSGSTSANAPHTVNQASTTTTITADTPDPSVVGQTVTVTFTVAAVAPGAGTPTGSVTVSDGTISCTVTVAIGECTLTFTSAGSRTLTATYTGDANFTGSASAGEPHTVNQAATVTTITADTPDPSLVGETVTVSFTVTAVAPGVGTPTGNVTVSDGTDSCTGTVTAGQCTITFTSAGTKTLTATYAGDTNFSGSISAGVPHGVNTPGVRITPTTVGVTEGGATATYQVVLTSQVSAEVTIAITTDGKTTVSPTSLTFTTANWNVPQTVTVTAVDDQVAQGPHTSAISHSATSADTNYNGITITDVTATVADNDSASVSVTPTVVNVTEGGATATYAVVLTTQPTADVTIAVATDGKTTVSPTSLTFTAANWNVPQTVTVTAVDDHLAQGAHTSTITHSATSTDTNYNGITIASVTANIADNDTPGVSVTPTSVSVTEGGATATYAVVLNSQPTADVAIAIATDRQTTVSPTSLTFTVANWNVPQSVTVTAVDDAVVEGTHSSTISHRATSGDTGYNDISIANVTATITDNDTKPTTFSAFIPVVVHSVTTMQPEPTGLPDLVVDQINITKTTIEVVIRNQGTGPVTGPFWVDGYINPNPAPTKVNQIWPYLAREGMVWAVTGGALPLAPGGTLTLTIGDGLYRADLSTISSSLAAGTQVYIQVDSANANTNYGGVLETHEQNGGAYNNISSATVPAGGVKFNATPASEGTPADTHLPSRPTGSQ